MKCDKINSAINNDDPNLPPLIDSNYYDIKEFNACKMINYQVLGSFILILLLLISTLMI